MRDNVVPSPNGYVVFDDTVADKNFSHEIDLALRQHVDDI